jgi:carboxypeptidase C (cathepsin A)
MSARLLASLVTLGFLAGCSGGGGSTPPRPPPPVQTLWTNPTVYSSDPNASLASAPEITSVTQHQASIQGATLAYTATAGHLNALSLGTGAARASFFYVAYTLDGAAPSTRPITFFYNGGPGSATVWLHLGSFGPKRLATGMPATTGQTPYPLVDNAESLLDVSDLVFVDAIGSGYSQAIAPNVNRTFYGVDADAEVFRDFVMRYAIVNNRSSSPKFLFGESYGGPRTAVLADLLESAGVRLAGVVLQSPAMDYSSNCDIGGAAPCTGFIPSYSATGAWFSLTTPVPAPAEVPAFLAQMRTFAVTEFDPAVRALNSTGVRPSAVLLDRMAANTGLRRTAWEQQLNRGPTYYRANLQAGTLSGRYDTRVILPNNSLPGQEGDPSSSVISPSFQVRITEYLTGTLRYTTPSSYMLLSNAINTWNFAHDGRAVPDTIPDLAAAIAQNPRLKVLAVSGYHDVATPFFTTERDIARLGANPNVQVLNYIGGHMTYLDDNSRRQMKADLAQWYRSALAN